MLVVTEVAAAAVALFTASATAVVASWAMAVASVSRNTRPREVGSVWPSEPLLN